MLTQWVLWFSSRRARLCSTRAVITALACAVGSATWAAAAGATEIRSFELAREGASYRLHLDIALRAELRDVRAVLARYERIPKLDPDITEVITIGANNDGSVRMRLAASQCVAWVCVPYRWTQDVRTLPSGDIVAEIVPGGGDIRAGRVRYRAVRDGDGTRLIVDADIDASGGPLPAPLLAPWMEARLRDEALETARLVELAAGERAAAYRSSEAAALRSNEWDSAPI